MINSFCTVFHALILSSNLRRWKTSLLRSTSIRLMNSLAIALRLASKAWFIICDEDIGWWSEWVGIMKRDTSNERVLCNIWYATHSSLCRGCAEIEGNKTKLDNVMEWLEHWSRMWDPVFKPLLNYETHWGILVQLQQTKSVCEDKMWVWEEPHMLLWKPCTKAGIKM